METKPSNVFSLAERSPSGDAGRAEKLRIGAEMQDMVTELRRLGGELSERVNEHLQDSEAQTQFGSILENIAQHHCRIAIIGQVKAGKSAFINALVGRKRFLPCDVNPWTAVVTRLHFGRPGLPDKGAKFTFFDRDEWHKIAQGGGKLRELVERFLPGYQSDLLGRRLDEMRQRAQDRLGDQFHQLLGKTHKFEYVSPAILERYVCAGNTDTTSPENQHSGRYADVTKKADVFLKSTPFVYPTTVIDTPGTNDPFLIRDEITCQNIESADILVIVLTAQQAFSMSDLALLRILQGLRKDKVAVFVNRIDQLDNPTSDVPKIIAHVRHMLKKEFPAIEFPIVAGSALWGEYAISAGEEENIPKAADKIRAYAQSRLGHQGQESRNRDGKAERFHEDDLRSLYFEISGIPAVAQIISKLMITSMKPRSIGKIASSFHVIGDVIQTAFTRELNALSSVDAGTKVQDSSKPIPSTRNQDSDQTQKTGIDILKIQDDLKSIKTETLNQLRTSLGSVVDGFAEEQANELQNALEGGWSDKVWTCDTLGIRRALEDDFLELCRQAAKRINDIEDAAYSELKKVSTDFMPKETIQAKANEVTESERDRAADPPWAAQHHTHSYKDGPLPSAFALSQVIALDLGQSWWKLWWRGSTRSEEWAKRFSSLIKSEFAPLLEQLLQSAKLDLTAYQLQVLESLKAAHQSVLRMTGDQTTGPDGVSQKAPVPTSPAEFDEGAHKREVQVFRERIVQTKTLLNGLKLLAERYTRLAST
ncbi:MAG: dynamin family protein [Methyloligellaceae bacterium]